MIPMRFGRLSADPSMPDEPNVYADVIYLGPFRWWWRITTGESGHAWTRAGALHKAHQAAWRA